MLAPLDKAAKQQWWLTHPGVLELAGYVAVFLSVFLLVYWFLS
jgi:hypothetical protein